MKPSKRKYTDSQVLSAPLKKNSVVSLVIDRIKEAITRKEIKTGDFLPSEAEMAQSLGVGKSSVREALKMLEAMGVVEICQGKGTYIPQKPPTNTVSPLLFQLLLEQASSRNLLELRMIFEPAYTQLAMERATESDFARIEDAIRRMEEKVENGDQTAEDDLFFHETIMDVTQNPLIINIGRTIHELFKVSVSSSMKNIPKKALQDHKNILSAMQSKDPKKLHEAVLNSYKGWLESLQTTLPLDTTILDQER